MLQVIAGKLYDLGFVIHNEDSLHRITAVIIHAPLRNMNHSKLIFWHIGIIEVLRALRARKTSIMHFTPLPCLAACLTVRQVMIRQAMAKAERWEKVG